MGECSKNCIKLVNCSRPKRLAIWLPSLRAKPVSWPFQGKVSERLAFWNLGSIHNNTSGFSFEKLFPMRDNHFPDTSSLGLIYCISGAEQPQND